MSDENMYVSPTTTLPAYGF